MRLKLVLAALILTASGIGLYASGLVSLDTARLPEALKVEARKPEVAVTLPPAVTVSRVAPAAFNETVVVTGTLVARDEIMVAPEVEGLRVVDVAVEEGARVAKGQVMARLVSEALDAQMAQNDANIARSNAALDQARSAIVQADARVMEAGNAYERAKPLRESGVISPSIFDQRVAAARTAEAQATSARDGLKVAEAERAQIEAQRRELTWKRSNTEVKAPADGIVSRRNARVGAIAAAGAADAMFRIIARGEIELDAEVPEAQLTKIQEGQAARAFVAGTDDAPGKVRLISPEIDKVTRLGRVRIFLGDNPRLRIGAFGRGVIETARSRGLAVPVSAVVYNGDSTTVQVVIKNVVETRRIKTGLSVDGLVEIREGLADGDLIVTRAGTFLRNGDIVRPILPTANKLTEVK